VGHDGVTRFSDPLAVPIAVPIAFRRTRRGGEEALPPDRSVGDVQFGLYLSDASELNIKRRSEARDFVGHVLLKTVRRPTTKGSMIHSGFRCHDAFNSFHLWNAQSSGRVPKARPA
jgi:hypothetical protein